MFTHSTGTPMLHTCTDRKTHKPTDKAKLLPQSANN